MKGYVTKYALTQGIFEVEAEPGGWSKANPKYVYAKNGGHEQYVVGTNFFVSKEDAIAAAKRMALKKVYALRRQIADLEKLTEQVRWRRP